MTTRNMLIFIAGLVLVILPLANFDYIIEKINIEKFNLGYEIIALDKIYSIKDSSTSAGLLTNIVILTNSNNHSEYVDVKCFGGIFHDTFIMGTDGDGPFIQNANFSVIKNLEENNYTIQNLFLPGDSISALVILGNCDIKVLQRNKPIPKAAILSQFEVVGFLVVGLFLIVLVVLAIFFNMFPFMSSSQNNDNDINIGSKKE